ncbi:MAG: type I restriction endonuclease subunit R [Leptolyngbyaceae bacterium]|nr:type I restriction endonuclease subunit R [Leptolyngbyaceae bacterium]
MGNKRMSVAVTEAITTLAEAEAQFHLTRTESDRFFQEWCVDLPALTESEKASVLELRRRYLYQRSLGHLLENTVTLLFASPLLTLAGFYDPPFAIKAEESVQLVLTDSEEVLQGRLDVLVLKEQIWVVVLESKKTALSVWSALPQTLAYLMANPDPARSSFALMTNGDDSVFVKLSQVEGRQYDVSRVFATLTSVQELQGVLQGLKQLSNLAQL